MKKEKRKATLGVLEKRRRFIIKVFLVISALEVVMLGTTLIISFIRLIPREILGLLMLIIVILINILIVLTIILDNIEKKISSKKDEIKLRTLIELAGDGNNLKEFVDLNDREIIEDILSIGIDKLVITSVESKENELLKKDSKFKLSVFLKNGCTIAPVSISGDKFFKLLNSKLEDQILKEVITDINIYNEEDYPENEKDLIISGGKSLCYEVRVKEEDLLDILNLKDDE